LFWDGVAWWSADHKLIWDGSRWQPAGIRAPADPPPARKRQGILGDLRDYRWWQLLLAFMPLGNLVIGGLLGAAIGLFGAYANLALARRKMSIGVQLAAMIGIVIGCYVVTVVIAALVYSATHPT